MFHDELYDRYDRHVSACRCIWCASDPYLDAIFQANSVRRVINIVIHNRAHLDNTQLQLSSKNLIQRLETVVNEAKAEENEPEALIEEINKVREHFVSLLLK